MGKIVSQHSDYTLITSDNPRSEDPSEICRAIEFGCLKEKQVLVEVDRRDAIEKALALAEDGDILLIAGRGHEMHQIIGHKRIPFNDAEVVKELLGKDLART
ncbi:MAG: UDP-N-acetylmuramoyl-L-alanyl-D-glutamate--LD-lysine ligase [Chlamydiae bacterium]|nr:UDP-N-acetylmuramoyl-L-alanyl-D-glutamate--LD-lysine ligase [Chlamydiota bacterium]